jgi:hypothetical protein
MTASTAGPGTQQTAQLPPQPQTRRVTRRGCHLNVPKRGKATPVPTAPARPTPRRASRDGSTPMHQPGPPHASADGAPRPILCHAAPTRQPAHNARQQHSTTPLPPPLDSAAEPPDMVAPPRSYHPLPTLPTHHQQFAGNVGAQVGHGSLGGEATFTRAAAAAALRPPPPRGAGLFTSLISILI